MCPDGDQAIEQACVVELFVLYDVASACKGDPRFSRSRKTAFGSRTVEHCVLWLPGPKKQVLKVQPRAHYTKVGESSTHDCTYSGVEVRSFDALPKMSAEDKGLMLGATLKLNNCVDRI